MTWAATPKSGATTTFTDGDFSHGETSAYLDLIVEQSTVGRLGLRRVPLDSRVTSSDTGAVAHWVGQSQAKPVSKMSLSATPLTQKKVVALCVVANEVLNSNSPEAENLIKADLARSASAGLDEKFLSADAVNDAEPAASLLASWLKLPSPIFRKASRC